MGPFNLSVRLLIVDLVGRYLTNYLIRRELIFQRIAPLVFRWCHPNTLCGISDRFQSLSPSERQIAHALLTRPPLSREFQSRRIFQNDSVRLACVRHAASVHPEPGSNSLKIVFKEPKFLKSTLESDVSLYFNWSCDFQWFTKSKKLSKFQVRTTTFVLLNKSLSTSLFNLQGTICCFQRVFTTFRCS